MQRILESAEGIVTPGCLLREVPVDIFFFKNGKSTDLSPKRHAEALALNNTGGRVIRTGQESNPTDLRERTAFCH